MSPLLSDTLQIQCFPGIEQLPDEHRETVAICLAAEHPKRFLFAIWHHIQYECPPPDEYWQQPPAGQPTQQVTDVGAEALNYNHHLLTDVVRVPKYSTMNT